MHLDTATVRKRMGVVASAVPSQFGAASPSAGAARRYNGGSVKMHPDASSISGNPTGAPLHYGVTGREIFQSQRHRPPAITTADRKRTRLNSSHITLSY